MERGALAQDRDNLGTSRVVSPFRAGAYWTSLVTQIDSLDGVPAIRQLTLPGGLHGGKQPRRAA